MSGLVLKLSPKERLLINGAVIENGAKRSRFSVITPNANILRLKDALHPKQARTPVRRVCYIAQLVLSGDIDEESASSQLLEGISQLQQVMGGSICQKVLILAQDAIESGQYYQGLKCLRQLVPFEDALLAKAPG